MTDRSTVTPVKTRYIAPKNTLPHLPVVSTVVLWLLLDRVQPPGWVLGLVWGLWGMFVALLFVHRLLVIFSSRYVLVDVFEALDEKCECTNNPAAKRRAANNPLTQEVADAVKAAIQGRHPPLN
jgi:hypothetical protein